ncbi:MAG: hypothetical protein HXX08_22330 [Chloroflexi bacterium]|uniref:Uncharacterized protein n=1 Tax=Candidatus Chlorohelix allophototropha TaxID=3003348 RepID=A0A8T7M9A1_9CHLR|nr:hypothetical protein [Chloroflexota bacterium]WJW68536.1 hypothetical protein OZ401_004150 [Chloroflexota bacterium L227-S17]
MTRRVTPRRGCDPPFVCCPTPPDKHHPSRAHPDAPLPIDSHEIWFVGAVREPPGIDCVCCPNPHDKRHPVPFRIQAKGGLFAYALSPDCCSSHL